MTAALVGLKLALLRNGLRQSTARKAAFVTGGVVMLLIAAGWSLGLVALRGNEHAPDLVVVVFVLLGVGWAAFPLFFFGGDETLDPTRLAMLPPPASGWEVPPGRASWSGGCSRPR